jgi:hypothetical protein
MDMKIYMLIFFPHIRVGGPREKERGCYRDENNYSENM